MKKVFVLIAIATMVFSMVFSAGNAETKVGEDKVYQLKLGHIQPTDHPNGKGAEYFAKILNEKSNGRIKVSVFPASQLGTESELFDSVALGSLDFSVIGFGDAAKQYPPFLLLDAPYLARDRDHWTRILNSDVLLEMQKGLLDAAGVGVLSNFYYGARWMTTSNLEVRKPADLAGHTIRVPDQKMYVDTLNAMGATATPMAFSEVFLALQQNVIDGQENPLATIASNSFDEVQKYLIRTEHIIGGNCFYISKKTIDKLPTDLMEIVYECGIEAGEYITKLAFAAEDRYKQVIVDNGMILIEDVDKTAFINATSNIYTNLAKTVGSKLIDDIRSIK